jgi:L-arabinose isomerase
VRTPSPRARISRFGLGLDLDPGTRGCGVGVEARVKLGPVSLLALTQTPEGMLKLPATQGEGIPGARLQIGNANRRIG